MSEHLNSGGLIMAATHTDLGLAGAKNFHFGNGPGGQ
jgi:ABC-type transport system involved in cytochrome c biogenesis ATPase subunit